jgi:CheY-like chemotaxis protein
MLGTVTLLRSLGAKPFGPEDAKVMEILARRVAMAVENARLKREQEEFLAMLGHELRNPVSAIRHSAAVLQSQLPDSHRNLSAIVMRQSKHLTRLVDDLVDLTRVRYGKMVLKKEVVDLEAAVRSCVETLEQSGRSDTWRIRIHAEPVSIQGDPVRLRQIVENLLDNALKYSPPGSPVELDVHARGDDAVLTVRDHGKGIPVELAGRIFDPFVQARGAEDTLTGGLGLGLALVQRLVRLHDGRIEVHSAGRDAGSEFILRFPAVAQPASAGNGAAHDPLTPALRILIVEDNRDSREALRLLLELWGHVVREADDGPQALAHVATFHPHLAFVDIGLPGMDGYEVARTLRAAPHPPHSIVALTGFGRPGDRRRALESGFDEHLLKPPAPEDLHAVLEKAGCHGAGQ